MEKQKKQITLSELPIDVTGKIIVLNCSRKS